MELAAPERPVRLLGVGAHRLPHRLARAAAEERLGLLRLGRNLGQGAVAGRRRGIGLGARRGRLRGLVDHRRTVGSRRRRRVLGRNRGDRGGTGQLQHLTRVDPVRILDHAGVQPVDVGPEERIALVLARQIPKRIALADGVALRGAVPRDGTLRDGSLRGSAARWWPARRRGRGWQPARRRPARTNGTCAASGSPERDGLPDGSGRTRAKPTPGVPGGGPSASSDWRLCGCDAAPRPCQPPEFRALPRGARAAGKSQVPLGVRARARHRPDRAAGR